MHSDDYYYTIRDERPDGLIERAARVIYLNRTCFNGIYRVNLAGEFNVPRGTKTAVLLDTDCFEAMASLLARAQLRLSDFEALIDEAVKGDFIFADPPYTVRHNYNGFIKYNEKLFSWDDQERLAAALIRAVDRGAKVATNADHESVRRLYRNTGLRTRHVSRFSAISANAKSRKQFSELIILSDESDARRRSAKT
jgi:DNA adenine methylase